MGVNLKSVIIKHPVKVEDFVGKVLVVDGFNMLYQFLSTIRAPDGSLFIDKKGRVTSHLIGLFSRTANLATKGIKLAFVFDGKVPKLKRQEIAERAAVKVEAKKKYEKAAKAGDVEAMRKYAARTSKLTPEMVDQAKRLLSLLGIPWIQAPSEGEAQAAFIVKKGDGWAVASQDYDSLLYGSTRLVQNLSAQRRQSFPELIDLDENLSALGISQNQLIALAILIGTDYNPRGVHGLGPKKGLSLVKKFGEDFDKLFESVGWDYEFAWQDIFKLFKEMPVVEDYKLVWKPIITEDVANFLVGEHGFSPERVKKTLERFAKVPAGQKGLGDFL